jgi:D-glycero-D-manno-heptose 1,7-bisphosphate phosphatase
MIKLIIFDRDDTLNVDVGFTHDLEDLDLVKGAKDVCEYIRKENLLYGVATNQSGIGEKYYTEDKMHEFNRALFNELNLIYSRDIVAHCHHRRQMTPRCKCRKPSPFLLLKLFSHFNVTPKESIFIGDRETDKESTESAGCFFISIDPLVGHTDTIEKIKNIQNL